MKMKCPYYAIQEIDLNTCLINCLKPKQSQYFMSQ